MALMLLCNKRFQMFVLFRCFFLYALVDCGGLCGATHPDFVNVCLGGCDSYQILAQGLSGGYSSSEDDDSDDETTCYGSFGPIHFPQWQTCIELQNNLQAYFVGHCGENLSENTLKNIYGKRISASEGVLADVVSLIYRGNNILYDHTNNSYTLRLEAWPVPFQEGDGREAFLSLLSETDFAHYSLHQQTYRLYEKGYLDVQKSTVAVFHCVVKQDREGYKWCVTADHLTHLIALKNAVLMEKRIRQVCEYTSLFKWGTLIRAQDVEIVKKSLSLFLEGRVILGIQPSDGPYKPRKYETQKTEFDGVVLSYLRNRYGQPCHEEDLLQAIYLYRASKGRASLYRIIIDLRKKRHVNIVHDSQNKTFTLQRSLRIFKGGSWEKVLWDMCDKIDHLWCSSAKVELEISDAGYDPVISRVTGVRLLKHFSRENVECSEFMRFAKNALKAWQAFQRRKLMWRVILEEKQVKKIGYYKSVAANIVEEDITVLKACWAVYSEGLCHFCGQVPQAEEAVKDFLQKRPEGVTVSDVRAYLQESGKDSTVWPKVFVLMRHGYAGHIDYRDGKLFWDPEGQKVAFVQGGFLDSLSDIARSEKIPALVALRLYHQGYFDASPLSIRKALDILVVSERIAPDLGSALTRVWLSKEDVGRAHSPSISRHLQGLFTLQRRGFLCLLKKKAPVLSQAFSACTIYEDEDENDDALWEGAGRAQDFSCYQGSGEDTPDAKRRRLEARQEMLRDLPDLPDLPVF